MTDPIVYKVLRAEEFARLEADSRFEGAPIDIADGYIHMSTAAQLAETIDKHFTDQGGLTIAAVDLAVLGDAVRWEPSRGGQLFPHLYAALPLSAVLAYGALERDEDGAVRLPVAG